jgi:fatty acid desaturase
MAENKSNHGIGVMKYAGEHEAYIRNCLEGDCDRKELARYHNMKIQWLQHERMIHLLVTILFALIFMFLFGILMLFPGDWLILIPLVIVIALLCAYIFHYFKLENTVQSWYKLYDEIDKRS